MNTHLAIRTGANVLVPDLGVTVKAIPKPNSVWFEYFSGGLKGWLSFWGEWKRINNDQTIDRVDKFQYLIRVAVPLSTTRFIFESYSPTGENYSRAVESLRARLGREDLLIEVYVRGQLKLVIWLISILIWANRIPTQITRHLKCNMTNFLQFFALWWSHVFRKSFLELGGDIQVFTQMKSIRLAWML